MLQYQRQKRLPACAALLEVSHLDSARLHPTVCVIAEVKPGVLFKCCPALVSEGSEESVQDGNLILK